MTSNKQNGGPVYPCKTYTQSGHPNGESMGMTLRDYFAGQALAGLLAGHGRPIQKIFLSDEALLCYEYADAMIAERDNK
jgi:hypothetical protein